MEEPVAIQTLKHNYLCQYVNGFTRPIMCDVNINNCYPNPCVNNYSVEVFYTDKLSSYTCVYSWMSEWIY